MYGKKADSTPIPMFVDAHGTVRGLMEQIFWSFTSDNVIEPHRIRLTCTNTNGGSLCVSTPFPLEANLVRYVYVSNDAKLESFCLNMHLSVFKSSPGNELLFVIDLFTPYY